MGCISVPTAMIGGSVLSGAGSLASGIFGSNASSQAASQQAQAAEMAAMIQQQEFAQTQRYLKPYREAGQGAITQLQNLTGTNAGGNPLTAALTKPFQPTMEQLAQTPGYQFTLQQGLQGVQNSAAAQGLGLSGAALKGAANYSTGLASTTYQQQFQNYLSQNQQIYNMISGQAGLGENAAAMTGNMGMQMASNVGNLVTGAGAATAGGIMGSNNALMGGITGGLNGIAGAGMMYGLTNGGMTGGLFGGGSAANAAIDNTQNWEEYGYAN